MLLFFSDWFGRKRLSEYRPTTDIVRPYPKTGCIEISPEKSTLKKSYKKGETAWATQLVKRGAVSFCFFQSESDRKMFTNRQSIDEHYFNFILFFCSTISRVYFTAKFRRPQKPLPVEKKYWIRRFFWIFNAVKKCFWPIFMKREF